MTYMGQTLLNKDKTPRITPLGSRDYSTQILEPPRTPNEYKRLYGLINYFSMYLKNLQKRWIPIYDLTIKGIPLNGQKNIK